MPKPANIAVLIVAAGSSSRLGRPKQLLPWLNSTIIGHAINTAFELQKERVYVVLGAHYNLIKPEIAASGVQILKNENWQEGLGSSIATGVLRLNSDHKTVDGVLILLADQPLITATYLEEMCILFDKQHRHIVATRYGKNGIGVPALFGRSYFDQLCQLSDDKGAKALIEQNRDKVIMPALLPNVTDIDTQEDYNKLRKANPQL